MDYGAAQKPQEIRAMPAEFTRGPSQPSGRTLDRGPTNPASTFAEQIADVHRRLVGQTDELVSNADRLEKFVRVMIGQDVPENGQTTQSPPSTNTVAAFHDLLNINEKQIARIRTALGALGV